MRKQTIYRSEQGKRVIQNQYEAYLKQENLDVERTYVQNSVR